MESCSATLRGACSYREDLNISTVSFQKFKMSTANYTSAQFIYIDRTHLQYPIPTPGLPLP